MEKLKVKVTLSKVKVKVMGGEKATEKGHIKRSWLCEHEHMVIVGLRATNGYGCRNNRQNVMFVQIKSV